MIYFIISLYFIVKIKAKHSLMRLFFALLLLSSIGSFLIGRLPEYELKYIPFTLYTAVLLFILFTSYKNYSNLREIDFSMVNKNRINSLSSIIFLIGIPLLFVEFGIFSMVMSMLLGGGVDINEFKGGDSLDFYEKVIPHYVTMVINLLSPIAYIALSLHFYYLLIGNLKKSALSFVVSLLIPFTGFLTLSRSSVAMYVLIYSAIFFLIIPVIPQRFYKKIKMILIIGMIVLAGVFIILSSSRYGESYNGMVDDKTIISPNNAMLFSTLDYFCQWETNGPRIVQKYNSGDEFWGLYNASGLASQILKYCGYPNIYDDTADKVQRVIGYDWIYFQGLVSSLVFDFGYIGAFIYIVLYAFFIRKLSPSKKAVNMKTLLALPVILPACLLFFAGNMFIYIWLDIAVIYAYLFFKLTHINHPRSFKTNALLVTN